MSVDSASQVTNGAVEATIYVVGGMCGEYSDRREWLVRAFNVEADARAFVEQCTHSGREVYALCERVGRYSDRAAIIKATSVDPNYDDDYTGPPEYYVTRCPMGPPAPVQQSADAPAI